MVVSKKLVRSYALLTTIMIDFVQIQINIQLYAMLYDAANNLIQY